MRKRMKTVRGLWAGLLAAAVVLTSAAPSALTVQAEEADAVQTAEVSGVEYQIYPTPHEMTYQDGGFDIGEVNIVYENIASGGIFCHIQVFFIQFFYCLDQFRIRVCMRVIGKQSVDV